MLLGGQEEEDIVEGGNAPLRWLPPTNKLNKEEV